MTYMSNRIRFVEELLKHWKETWPLVFFRSDCAVDDGVYLHLTLVAVEWDTGV